MDGLVVVLLIIGWIFSMSKKKKTAPKKKTVLNVNHQNAAALRAERIMHRHEALGQRRMQQERPAVQEATGEGQSQMPAEQSVFVQEQAFRGSLPAESTEGECLCDPVLEHEREEEINPASVYASEIGREPLVDFSAKGILQGVIMSEVLQRPAQRARQMR